MINKDKSETLVYNNPAHPVYLTHGRLGADKNYTFLSHWHDDLEFILVTKGSMFYYINGKSVFLETGDAVFVNSRRLHSSFAPGGQDCEYICFLVHPTLLCASSYIEEKYILPIVNGSVDYLSLPESKKEAKAALRIIRETFDLLGNVDFELKIQKPLFELWYEIYRLTDNKSESVSPQNYHLSALKVMIEFINKHYSEKITLEQIGRAGGFGETSCCRIFKKYTNKTPLNFLIDHRLQKGIELLLSTDLTVTEISTQTGFSSPSYFSEMFKKNYGCSPREYKQNNSRE